MMITIFSSLSLAVDGGLLYRNLLHHRGNKADPDVVVGSESLDTQMPGQNLYVAR